MFTFIEITDLTTGLRIVQIYYANSSSPISTLRAYCSENNLKNKSFTVQAIISLISKFEETYSLHDKPSLIEERTDSVIETLDKLQAANPLTHASSSHVALETENTLPCIPIICNVHRLLQRMIRLHSFSIGRNS